ncbi:MAG: zinc ABC transporter substrate-binding protein [Clostridia bacterium]|nr:zinc ABC transporter substrate-binding protein [Clostridia bacterium]
MKKAVSILLAVIVTALTFCSCGTETNNTTSGINIVCTAFPQYDFVKNIIGTEEGLTLLLDDGADLHSYEPTAQDIILIGSADIFIYGGGASDDWVEGVLESANNPDITTIATMDLVDTLKEEYLVGMQQDKHEHEHSGIHKGDHIGEDEHIWLSLKNAVTITEKLCETICNVYPENAEEYLINSKNYISDLSALDSEYSAQIESSARKTLLFADRFPFRYLSADYGITCFAAFAGCSSESEASFETMAFLIDKTKELALPVILTIDGSDGSLAKTVSDTTGASIRSLDSCQSVSSADISRGTSYIGIMKSNLEILREALN